MKRLIRFSVAFGVMIALNGVAHATDFVHDGKVDVYQALSVAETAELDFGAVTDSDGTITLDLGGSIASDPGGISVGGTVASGVYTINGEPSQIVSVSLSGSSANGLTIDNFTTSEGDLGNVSLDGVSGDAAITIGADLTVSSGSAAPGADQALSFTISVSYN